MKKVLAMLAVFLLILSLSSLASAQERKNWPTRGVTLGAAPVGGVYYIWSGGPAKILNEKLKIPTSVESTGGPVHNTQLVNIKELHFGMVTSAPAYEGWHGLGWAKGKKHQNIRVIFPMYTTYFHMYALKKSGIKGVKDLNGKTVGTGPIGGTPATYWPLILKAGGITPKRIVNASSSDLDNQLKDGLLDANGQSVGLPWGMVSAVETTHDIVTFGVEEDVCRAFIKEYPFFSQGIIPKGTYKSAPADLTTLTVWNFFITYAEMPADLVYELTKEIFKNKDILMQVHKSAKEVEPKNVLFSPIPLHPGAVKYYEEIGLQIPKELKSS
jgi:uncharacterized protein